MNEKVYKANGRKEHLVIKNTNSPFQNQYNNDYDDYGELVRKDNNFKQKIGEGKVDGLNWYSSFSYSKRFIRFRTWITQLDNASMTTTSEQVLSSYIRFKWSKLEGVLGFSGKIAFKLTVGERVVAHKQVDALVEFSGQWIGIRDLQKTSEILGNVPVQNQNQGWHQRNEQNKCTIAFSFEITPVFAFSPVTNIISNFAKTHNTDVILEVQGKQLNANKSFLSIHSEFFDKLFNSDFKEKSQGIIKIREVDFEDFSNFLSLIYPNQAEITVEKVFKYLDLANQYLMPTVTRQCEEFLLRNNRVKAIQKLVFADKYFLNKLLRETLAMVETKEELEALTLYPEFTTFSDSTKAALLHKFMHFLN